MGNDVTEFMLNLQICKLRENLSANVIEKGWTTVHLIVIRLPWYSYDIPWIMISVPMALEYTIHGGGANSVKTV